MADLKTSPTGASVKAFLDAVQPRSRRRDARRVAAIMRRVTGAKAQMWGPSIVGYGTYHYVYDSGREGDWMLTGFSPRNSALTLYIMSGFDGEAALMRRLGKYRTGKSCLYLNNLDDVDPAAVEELITRSVARIRSRYG